MSWGLNSLGTAIEDNFSPAGLEKRRAVREASEFNRKLMGMSDEVWNRAKKLADRPYEAYGGQRVADLSPQEQQALELSSNEGTLPMENYQKAGTQIDNVANNGFSGDTISKYMNPYTEQVTNRAINNINLNAGQRMSQLQGQSASRNAFGSTRSAMLENLAEKDRLSQIADTTAQGNANAYDKAVQTWQADNQRSLAASQAYREAGNDIMKMNSQHVSDLLLTGGTARVLQQMKLDDNYQQFLDKQNWDANNLNYLVQALGAARGNQASPYGLPQAGNTAGQVMGAVSAIAGMIKSFKSNNSSGSTSNTYYNYSSDGSNSGYSGGYIVNMPSSSGGSSLGGD